MEELTEQLDNLKIIDKFSAGEKARKIWSKKINVHHLFSKIEDFNKECENNFIELALIELDKSTKRQSTLLAKYKDKNLWKEEREHIYIITRNDYILKIGGTREGMAKRWSSYGCGYYVSQRKNKKGVPYPGKMSVTNAYVYHTIEEDLLINENVWKIYTWPIPKVKLEIEILGIKKEVLAQTFHAYESCCIKKFKELNNKIPMLCNNCDPNYFR